MSGIAGAIGNAEPELVRRMTRALKHRGADNEGYYTGNGVGLGIAGLSILDGPTGNQPIYNEAGDKCIIFNGEIYNYQQLREDLRRRGHQFSTTSDTEVILHLYEEYGEECVEYLRGMFAFAIADGNKVLLARDRYGIKPLYYVQPEKGLALFASEVKALLQSGRVSPAIDPEALADGIVTGFVVGEGTYFKGIKALRPGHLMVLEHNVDIIDVKNQEYFHFSLEPDAGMPLECAIEEAGSLIRKSVEAQLSAGVDVGILLSGGLDSGLLMMAAAETRRDIKAFTVAFAGRTSELRHARNVSARAGAAQNDVVIEFDEYVREIPRSIWAEECPSSLFSLPFFVLCKHAAKQTRTCLMGEGADVLFCGMPGYFRASPQVKALRAGITRAKENGLPIRQETGELVEGLQGAASFDEYLRKIHIHNIRRLLPNRNFAGIDRISMAWGLELRLPYMAEALVELLNRVPFDFKAHKSLSIPKYLLKRVAVRSYGSDLSDKVLRRKFAPAGHGSNRMRQFDEMCALNLPADYVTRHEFGALFPSKVDLLLFDLFQRIFIEGRGEIPDGLEMNEFIKEKSSRKALMGSLHWRVA